MQNPFRNERIFFFGRSLRSGFRLYSRLTKTTAKKPCFSKSGDTASIPNAEKRFKGTEMQRYRGSKVQRYRGTEVQSGEGVEVQRFRGTGKLKFLVNSLQLQL